MPIFTGRAWTVSYLHLHRQSAEKQSELQRITPTPAMST